ncbi:hypothetical protein Vadar_026846 [Vaccinium darrowii]|uniref:Uncharacterized protein n=1 Tax=Vaccinium darrowii TaxID=229202 RepID=A0ACB7Y3J8_9ERIC|nr:hypothetical protein Vadar_026846 [Vaccinium darrowii]
MAKPSLVKVLDVCKVAPMPHSPNSATQTSLPLTFFDVFWLRFPPNQHLFFYEFPNPKATLTETILPKLKHSLCVTFQHYLPLAGNLMWPPDADKPIIQYSKGFAIGYAAHHAVFDGKSIALFMHSWASMCRRGGNSTLALELTPFYDRTIVNDPTNIEQAYLNCWVAHNGPNNRSLEIWDLKAPLDAILGTFQLTQANIQCIKKWVTVKWQEKQAFHSSNFAVTSAYTWVCLIKTLKLTTEKVQLGVNIDCRSRLKPPIPSTYFGNCVTGCIVYADTSKLMEEDGVAIAARAIGEAIGGLDDGVLKGAEDLISNLLSIQKDVSLFSITGSPRFESYNTDFGWGRPKKVEIVSIEKSGAFSLSDSRDGNGGVEIGVVLKKHETEAFASMFISGLECHQVHEN